MGMFTSVQDPNTKEEIQFNTGWGDGCESYQLGDLLKYELDEYEDKSDIFDGLDYNYKTKESKEYLVVVIENRIVALVYLQDLEDRCLIRQILRKIYEIEPYSSWEEIAREITGPPWQKKLWDKLWPWSVQNKQSRKGKKITPEELARSFANPIKAMMGYESLARQVFKVEGMPDQEELKKQAEKVVIEIREETEDY